ncbi:protein CFAP20DC-like isoform X2 [Apostichopus japonicus]|uniref:protein CFAP20DC-like isoform X2 n=1 Tax=Stichopus japonicus TaxID=307972 RepID=UPI003AB5A363
MFKSQFQGGPFVEVFSCQGKEPLSKWKVSGSSIQKTYEKEVKSYVFTLEGSSTTTKMHLPKDSKQTLALIQRYFLIQLNAPMGAALSLELGIMDNSNNKRRLLFSTAQKEISITPLHVKLPLQVLRRGMWLNLCLDLTSIVGEAFRGQTFKSLDSITLSASCKVRKIFTMKNQPQDSTDDDDLYEISPSTNSVEIEVIPRTCQFPFDVVHQTQVVNMSKLRHVEIKMRMDASRPPSSTEPDLNSSMKGKDDKPMHIAFGTKVPVPQSNQTRKATSAPSREGSVTSRSSRSSGTHREITNSGDVTSRKEGHSRQRSDPGSEVKDPSLNSERGTLTGSRTWSAGVVQLDDKMAHQPHPPRQKSAEKSRRVVKVRPSSGKRESESSQNSQKKELKERTSNGTANGSTQGHYDPQRYTSRGKGSRDDTEDWHEFDPSSGQSDRQSRNLELRTSSEVKVTSRSDTETRPPPQRRESESSEGVMPESEGNSDSLSNSLKMASIHSRGESQSESDEVTRNKVKGHKSKIPKKKRSQKKLGLMDSLSENEEVQYDLRRIREERRELTQTDSGVALTESRTSVEIVSSLEEDGSSTHSKPEGAKSINRPAENGANSNLYTFMSPPRSAPTRQLPPERSSYLDQKALQAKLQKIQESSPPSDEGIIPHEAAGSQVNYNSSDFTKNTLDASLSEDTYASIMKRTPSPCLGRSPVSKDVKMETSRGDDDDDDEDYGSGSPLPVQSHSPTLRRWKLNSSAKGGAEHSGIDKSRSGLVGTDGMPQPMASQVSPRGMGTMSRLSIHASKVKEIPKNDPRLSDDYDWRKHHSNSSSLASSLEAKMLASLKREQLEEMYEEDKGPEANNSFELHNYGDDDLSSSSDDTTTTFSTWKPPDVNKRGHRFQDEMHFPAAEEKLMQSNPRDWGNLFSPPIVLPSEKMKEEVLVEQLSPGKENPAGGSLGYQRQASSTGSEGGSSGVLTTGPDVHGEDELDLLYDPCLNCYFDPVTGKYYELA